MYKSGTKEAFSLITYPYQASSPELNKQYNLTAKKLHEKLSDNFEMRFVDKHIQQSLSSKTIEILTVGAALAQDDECGIVNATAYQEKLPPKELAKFSKVINQRLSPEVNGQITRDALAVAKNSPDKTKGIATLYGIGHTLGNRDIDEGLAKNGKTVTIALLESNGPQPFKVKLDPETTDIPDYSYFIKENEAVANATPEAKKAFTDLFLPKATTLTKDECLARIPESIQDIPEVRAMLGKPQLNASEYTGLAPMASDLPQPKAPKKAANPRK